MLYNNILEVNPKFGAKNINKPDKLPEVQNQNKHTKTSLGQKVGTQDNVGQNVVNPEIKKENSNKTNKKLLLSLGGLAVVATAGLLIRKRHLQKTAEQIKNLFESIHSTQNNINESIRRIQNNYKAAGGRPVHDSWATSGQNLAMDNIESIMRHVNGCYNNLVEKYNKLTTLIKDPVLKKEIKIESIKDKIAQVELNINIAENTGYKPAWGGWESTGSNDKYFKVLELESLLDKLKKELASLQK